jgi:hypothetical protein
LVVKYKYKVCNSIVTVLLTVAAGCFFSCEAKKETRKVERAFYYWKSVFSLTAYELQALDTLHIQTLYIKFFDVGWNNETQTAVPEAKLQVSNMALLQKFSIVPTIFITNECIQKIHSSQIETLTENIFRLTGEIMHRAGIETTKEIQIDCDWTAGSRSNYFLLLEKINQLYKDAGITLSATIRLHQIKFMGKTGVPPVKKGLLMCYNMGNLKNPATNNSILETTELEKYTANLSKYPLQLDVALPLFSWKVLLRNNIYNGLIQNLPDSFLINSAVTKNNQRFTFLKDTTLAGYEFKKGDVLRNEESSCKEIISAAETISRQLKNTSLRVSLYHLDSVILKKYSLHELETVYNSLH